ncbi:hypothetical protein Tco_1273610 [Tanacetum coccineum]
MAVLESCPKHNMVAYLEKTDGNAEFHEIIDFLTRSSIHYALTVIADKPVTISEASIRSDLHFDDVDGIDSLNNQAIFDAIKLMGYEGDLTVLTFNKALFSPQWKFLFHTLNHCLSSKSTSWDQIPINIATAVICLTSNQKFNFSKLIFDGMIRHLDAKKKFVMYPRFISIFLTNQLKNVPVPSDHFPINALTSKVFSFMVKKGKHFSGKVTPLFPNMLVQPTEDEGEGSERPSEPQPTPSPPHPSDAYFKPQPDPSSRPSSTIPITDPIPEGSGRNLGNQSSSDKSLSGSEGGLTLQSVYDLYLSLCTHVTTQAAEIKSLKAQVKRLKKKARPFILNHKAWLRTAQRKTVKSSKGAPTVPTNTEWDDLEMDIDDTMDYTFAQDEGKTDKVDEKGESTAQQQSTDRQDEGTDILKVSTDRTKLSTNKVKEGIPEAEKKFKQLARDEEMAKKVQEDWEAEEEVKKLAEEEAIKVELSNEYDFIRARLNADKILAEKLQEEEREMYTIEQRAKFLYDTIAAQRRFLDQQKSEAIRNKPPTKNQLRNQMMTYLKHVENKKHADLKTKSFEEIKFLYEKLKSFDDSFITVGSTKDERKIKEMNKGTSDSDKKKKVVKEDDTAKVSAKQDMTEQDSEVMEIKSVIVRLHKVSSPDGDYLVVLRANGNFRAFNYLLEGDLKIMIESSIEVTDQGDLWNDQQDWEIVTWRLYKACGVCILEFKDGIVIHMLVERKYPLSKELLQRMLDFGLEVEEESTDALDLIRVLNSPCFMVKSWLVQDQTVLGKDYSNLLIADSLLKTIWFINAPCYGNEALASPKANDFW